ncbi:unnamed protein product [Soboliphyme baturini]|uniref:Uncharacterized protein n=1 Tax=Soboliphyme baturini TaxID=241478 RepID=A0A183IA85_9BILA|nr:unnamed protein product [Soboliphyme baturini]
MRLVASGLRRRRRRRPEWSGNERMACIRPDVSQVRASLSVGRSTTAMEMSPTDRVLRAVAPSSYNGWLNEPSRSATAIIQTLHLDRYVNCPHSVIIGRRRRRRRRLLR